MILQRFHAFGPVAAAVTADVAAVLSRITIGHAFALTGMGKLLNHDATQQFFTSLGIPAPGLHAYGIGGLELVGGCLLIMGLGVRPIAFLLMGTMAVALITADSEAFRAALALNPEKGLSDVVPWMFGIVLIPLLAHGGGRASLDHLLWRWFAGRGPRYEAS
jgi:putative oxidoreductase